MKRAVCLVAVASFVGLLFSCGRQEEAAESPELKAQAEEFVELLVQEDFSRAAESFDSVIKGVMPPDKLHEVWKALVAESGAFQRRIPTRTEKAGQYDVAFVTCEFEKRVLDIKVVFNSAGQITGLWFVPPQPSGG